MTTITALCANVDHGMRKIARRDNATYRVTSAAITALIDAKVEQHDDDDVGDDDDALPSNDGEVKLSAKEMRERDELISVCV